MQIEPTLIKTPCLGTMERNALLMSLFWIERGGEVYCSVTYDKQTDAPDRVAGEDYVAMLGVSRKAQAGKLKFKHRVDNEKNRRDGVVGHPYLVIESFTRGDGIEPAKPTSLRPEGLTGFAITGFRPMKDA